MHYIAAIFFIGLGIAGLALAVGHEVYWWKRRAWLPSTGIIKDFKETHWADGGPTYSAVIEYKLNGAVRSFDSQYASGKKPTIGSHVPIVMSPGEDRAAEISQSHRIMITVASCVFGAIFIIVGSNIKPTSEQGVGGQPATPPRVGD